MAAETSTLDEFGGTIDDCTDCTERLPCFEHFQLGDRLSNLRTGTPHELELVTTIASENAKVVESLLHDIYRSGNRSGEWFKLTSNAVNSLIALDRLEPADLEPLTGGLIPSWLTDPTSLYLEVERVRRGDVDD